MRLRTLFHNKCAYLKVTEDKVRNQSKSQTEELPRHSL